MKKFFRHAILGSVRRLGFDLVRRTSQPERPSPLEMFLEGLLVSRRGLSIVQVGANDGKHADPLYKFLQSHPSRITALLIEPQPEIYEVLKSNYENIDNFRFFNGAIGTGNAITLFRLKPEYWERFAAPYMKDAPSYRAATGLTSASKTHVTNALEAWLDKRISAEQAIEEFVVQPVRLASLLERMRLGERVDFLQVDTEGFDDDVIYASDIDLTMPTAINFESVHLSGLKMENLVSYLTDKGYVLHYWSPTDCLAVKSP